MANVKVRVNYAAGGRLLKSTEVQNDISRRVAAVASRAQSFGDGEYEADVIVGKSRSVGMVKCKDRAARQTNSKTNALLKSLDAGR